MCSHLGVFTHLYIAATKRRALARPCTRSTGTGVWGHRLRVHAASPMPTGLSAECRGRCSCRLGASSFVQSHACQDTLANQTTFLNVEAIAQRRRCVSKASLTAPRACPPSATRAACARSAAKASWLSLRRALWGLARCTSSGLTRSATCGPRVFSAATRDSVPLPDPPPATRCNRSVAAGSVSFTLLDCFRRAQMH